MPHPASVPSAVVRRKGARINTIANHTNANTGVVDMLRPLASGGPLKELLLYQFGDNDDGLVLAFVTTNGTCSIMTDATHAVELGEYLVKLAGRKTGRKWCSTPGVINHAVPR
jgi:hypothetical protein